MSFFYKAYTSGITLVPNTGWGSWLIETLQVNPKSGKSVSRDVTKKTNLKVIKSYIYRPFHLLQSQISRCLHTFKSISLVLAKDT